MLCGCSSMAEHQLPKLNTRVRFPSPAPRIIKEYSCTPFIRDRVSTVNLYLPRLSFLVFS